MIKFQSYIEGKKTFQLVYEILNPSACLLFTDPVANVTGSNDQNATASKLNDAPEISDMQSDLVAPASGPQPLEAKYTIRVKPKLKDGVPQVQEIRIMPPKSNTTVKGFVKPLMVLKQNVTRPLIENIEIDVPEKGQKYASTPSVEVVEGDHRELLQVTKGPEAVIENASQKSETKPEGMILCFDRKLLDTIHCNTAQVSWGF